MIFDILIDLIYHNRKEIKINCNSTILSVFIPKIYYIGDGKSGSSSILNGFLNVNVAHWHNVSYFEKIYNTKLLTNNFYDLYDLIIYIGKKYNFKPVIIESTRNTINLGISRVFQHIKYDRKHDTKCKLCQIKNLQSINNIDSINNIVKEYILTTEVVKSPYSIKMYKKHFDIDLYSSFDTNLNYYFNNTNNVYLLFLKFENIEYWSKIINNHLSYNFVLKHYNKTINPFYKIVNENIKFTEKELKPIFDSNKFTYLYTNNEIENIKQKFIKN